ncbi:cytochrome P450 [Aquibacillus salsiterrae]|uniref:Cytochrome P450 n=1 Tax=Aquibacillus salsiterrae TaxID=2950439 RepID=A0A9X4AFW0_9BACI|nr:cytochrome P450 [Aquibacillus salsiterrae]MDC3418432.1 cytochrome P450 [Aquibacillus salsiterrae]
MEQNQSLPHVEGIDQSLALLKEGYLFIENRVNRFKLDIFEARVLGEKAIFMRGEEAAKIFYDSDKFQRKGAAPKRVQKTLFGKNAIQTLDGEEHLHRKLLFMSLLTPPNQKKLAELTTEHWEATLVRWENQESIVLFEEAKNILTSVVCKWAGVPLDESELTERADDFIAMIYSFGKIGPEHWQGRRARNRAEEWIRGVVELVRAGELEANSGTALYEMAFFEQPDGTRLDTQMAAVELINVLRPVVANATFITFAALALSQYKEQKQKLKTGTSDDMERFIHEVRRFYPFGPFLGARVRNNFTWNDVAFNKGTLVMLDIYGTNHDERIWGKPNEFNPERFKGWSGGLFAFIPHGGGDPAKGHRCPGEGVTLEVMKATLNFLVHKIEYDIPNQDLNYSLDQLPTLPKSGMELSNIRRL